MRLIVFFIALIASWPALGRPMTVKSGEHEGFTRLVVYLQGDEVWALSETLGLATLTIENWTEGFDISDVYQKIGTQRLRSLTASDSNLVLSLDCECTVLVEELNGRFLSLDIRDSAELKPTEISASLDEPEVIEASNNSSKTEFEREILKWPIVFEAKPIAPISDRIFNELTRTSAEVFENGLGREIAQGATLTYLNPSELASESVETVIDRPKTRARSELLAELAQRARFSNASTQSTKESTEQADTCPPASQFLISKWGGDKPFSDQLALLRSNLYSEFDELNTRGVFELVRFYTHYGLSQELERMIANYDDQSNFELLVKLSKIVDSSSQEAVNLGDIAKCGAETGFWAAVGGSVSNDLTQSQVTDLVGVFQKLPLHLKALTADRLIELFDGSSFSVAAGVVRNSLERVSDADPLADKAISLASDLETLPQDRLLELTKKSDELSPVALAYFMENAGSTNTPVSTEIIDLVAGYAHQLDGKDIAKRLLSSQVLALAHRGESNDAMELFFGNDEEKFLKPNKVMTKLIQSMLSNARSSEISQLVWKLENRGFFEELPEAELLELSQFLEDHGQPQLALLPLSKIEKSTLLTETKAGILAQSDRRNEAIDLLMELEDEVIDPRLSEILLDADPEAAWDLRARLSGVAAERAAWVSRNWSDVAEGDVRSEVSELILASQKEIGSPEKPIQNAQTAFSESKNARRTLQDLLK